MSRSTLTTAVGCLVAIGAIFLIVSVGGYTVRRGPSRPQWQLLMISTGIESYRAEHGHYPSDPATSEWLDPDMDFDPAQYIPASRFLYRALSGDSDGDPTTKSESDGKSFLEFPPEMLKPNPPGPQTYIADEWGHSLGYSTKRLRDSQKLNLQSNLNGSAFAESFQLRSTGTGTRADQASWIKTW